jgi:hypothetical protein
VSPACPDNIALATGEACDNSCGAGVCDATGQCVLDTYEAAGTPCGSSAGASCDGQGLCVPAALAPVAWPYWDNRVDTDGDGTHESYWLLGQQALRQRAALRGRRHDSRCERQSALPEREPLDQTDTPSAMCAHLDTDCTLAQLQAQSGSWSWEIVDAATGNVVSAHPGMYAWDAFPDG